MFSLKECEALKKFITSGRSVLVMMNEGGEGKLNTNINYLLEQFGISCQADCVVRTSFFKYLHPKEAYISHGNLSKDFTRLARGLGKQQKAGKGGYAEKYAEKDKTEDKDDGSGLNIVYAYGASLVTKKPAFPILSTGPVSYPTNRPILSAYTDRKSGGKLLVSGSVKMFDDEFIEKEENSKVLDGMLKFLTATDHEVEIADNTNKEESSISEYHRTPNTSQLSENLRSCLQESKPLPRDFTRLFKSPLF